MASARHLAFSSVIVRPLSGAPSHSSQSFLPPKTRTRISVRVRATASDFLGDFGARDPFPAEIESNFAEKVLGNVDTEHRILVPNAAALSLAQWDCVPASQILEALPKDEVQKLLFKVVGWRVVSEGGGLKLQGLWKVRDAKCGEELIDRIRRGVESTGHQPSLHLDEHNQVRAELWTASVGGLSINDFIVAAKIDKIKVSDLQPRVRVWA